VVPSIHPTITGHAWLARNTSGDDHDLSTLQAGSKTFAIWGVSGDLSPINMPLISSAQSVSSYSALGVDVADICGNTGSALDIVKGELAHARVELKKEGQRLANATAGAEDDDLGKLET
jgi:hypothetical protein